MAILHSMYRTVISILALYGHNFCWEYTGIDFIGFLAIIMIFYGSYRVNFSYKFQKSRTIYCVHGQLTSCQRQ